MKISITVIMFMLTIFYPTIGTPQSSGSVRSPLGINPGITVRQAVQTLKPEYQSYVLGGDSGWLLQIHDNSAYEQVLMSLWNDEFQDYVINYDLPVKVIMIHSPKFETKEGLYVGMRLKDVEKKLGKLKRIFKSEPTFEEFAEFIKMPNGIELKISGGIFDEGKRNTQAYSSDARITAIQISSW